MDYHTSPELHKTDSQKLDGEEMDIEIDKPQQGKFQEYGPGKQDIEEEIDENYVYNQEQFREDALLFRAYHDDLQKNFNGNEEEYAYLVSKTWFHKWLMYANHPPPMHELNNFLQEYVNEDLLSHENYKYLFYKEKLENGFKKTQSPYNKVLSMGLGLDSDFIIVQEVCSKLI